MESMSTGDLIERYAALTGQPVRTRHRAYLIRKIAWRLQADAEGDLSERARRRVAELANDADVRLMPAKEDPLDTPSGAAIKTVRVDNRDPRLPVVGTMITRAYKGRTLYVVVLADGFEPMGQRYKTLSAVAKAITGSHVNGFRFFGIGVAQ